MPDAVSAITSVYADLSRGIFVAGRKDRSQTNQPFGRFFHRNTLLLEVYPLALNPNAAVNLDPYFSVEVSSLSLNAAIFDTAGTKLAESTTFTADAASGKLSGSLNCDTAEMATWVTADKDVVVEFRFTGTGISKNVRATSQILKQFNSTGSPSVLPISNYLTQTETEALFVSRQGQSGKGFTLVSPDGTRTAIIYLDNDGVLRSDPVT